MEQTVNWLILVSDIVFASVAAILGILGLSTLRAIKHLGIGKSFWIPVFMSGILFLIGSAIRVFQGLMVELDWSLTINSDVIVRVSSLLALCILMGSIYIYSRKVKIEAKTRYYEVDKESQPQLLVHAQKTDEKKKKEKLQVKPSQKKDESIPVCPHHLGYLAEIPEDAPVPEECLTCPQMLECKNTPMVRTR